MILIKLRQAIARRHRTLKLSQEERERRNLARFRELAHFVEQFSPWYRRTIKTNCINVASCRPEDFPILTAAIVRENLDEIVTDRAVTRAGMMSFLDEARSQKALFLGRYHVVSSAGSSGLPAYYIHTTDELVNGMSYGIFHRRLKPRMRTTFIGILGQHMMSTTVMDLMGRWPERVLFNARNFDVREPWTQVLAGLNEHRPAVLTAYKHVLMRLAEDAQAGRLTIKPALLESGGEPLLRHEREFLRSAFECEVANSYGSSEMNLMGVALNDWKGLYLFEDDLIFELDDESTNVTNLYNRALPLIRYRFDDILVPVQVKNQHLPYRVVSEAIGRSQELISFATGEGADKKFKILIFEDVDFSGVRRVEFNKVDAVTLVVKVVFNEGGGSTEVISDTDQIKKLEQLRIAIREYLNKHELQGVRLKIFDVKADGINFGDELVKGEIKEKLIWNAML